MFRRRARVATAAILVFVLLVGGIITALRLSTPRVAYALVEDTTLVVLKGQVTLQHADNTRGNHLRITVVFRAKGTDLSTDLGWRKLCNQIFIDLRAYLMGRTPE